MQGLLVINAGSSSLKFAMFEMPLAENAQAFFRGQIDGIGAETKFMAKDMHGATMTETVIRPPAGTDLEGQPHQFALEYLLDWIETQQLALQAVGHRVLHGGDEYSAPVRITPEVLEKLASFIPLGPLHQPHNLWPIRTLTNKYPELPQVACFDTAFHRTQPWLAQTYPIPREFTQEGVKRYGFHGTSYEYVSRQLPAVIGDRARNAVVIAHLGNGASMAALRDLKCVATTMGFTAAEGLMMGTRSGSIDPAILLYLADRHGYTTDDQSRFLYKESGLLGVSGISQDMRTLEGSDAPEAKEAVDLFCYRAAREIGSLAMAAGGLDALIFTGGIGENSSHVRASIVAYLGWLGAELAEGANAQRGQARIVSTAGSRITVAVVPTNEEWMIAQHTVSLLGGSQGAGDINEKPTSVVSVTWANLRAGVLRH